MTTILSLTIYKYKILLIMIRDLVIIFVPAYVGSGDTPDSTLEDQRGVYDDIGFDYFDYMRGVPCIGTHEELGGSQL
jgi:hypothetical protein